MHTPGPWVLEFSEESGLAHILGPRGDGNVRPADGLGLLFYLDCATLADMNVGIFPDIEPEAKANAVLAVAAPDLLNALKAALPVVLSAPESTPGLDGRIQAIEAAIAKATGTP